MNIRIQILGVLGQLIASASLASLLFNVLEVNYSELQAMLMSPYVFLRDLFFLPLSWASNISDTLKDVVVVWLLTAYASVRIWRNTLGEENYKQKPNSFRYKVMLLGPWSYFTLLNATFHPGIAEHDRPVGALVLTGKVALIAIVFILLNP